MKKLLVSILTLGVVSAVALGATRAYFSSTEEVEGNSIQTKFLEIMWDGNISIWGNSMYFPVELAPGEDTSWVDTNGTPHNQRMNIKLAPGSMTPDHFEIKFATNNFVDGTVNGHGTSSNRSQYTKAVEVTKLNMYINDEVKDWHVHSLLSQINNDLDGDSSFLSLYDLENTIIRDVPASETLNVIEFTFKMSVDAGNQFQGDSLNLDVTIAAAQTAEQDVL